ncbi:MAG: hypothetical protein FJZ63_01765 [Chlamydiae bacterium]|nr:hypothetical protein [Chlamydiota bacterium]
MKTRLTLENFPRCPVEWLEQNSAQEIEKHPDLHKKVTLCVIEPTQPYVTDLFEEHKKKSWAEIFPPPLFFEQLNRFFCSSILPGIQADSLLENFKNKLEVENLTLMKEATILLTCLETVSFLEKELHHLLHKLSCTKKA